MPPAVFLSVFITLLQMSFSGRLNNHGSITSHQNSNNVVPLSISSQKTEEDKCSIAHVSEKPFKKNLLKIDVGQLCFRSFIRAESWMRNKDKPLFKIGWLAKAN